MGVFADENRAERNDEANSQDSRGIARSGVAVDGGESESKATEPAQETGTSGAGEEWRPVAGFEWYEVSSLGRVRSMAPLGRAKSQPKHPRILKACMSGRYLAVGLYRPGGPRRPRIRYVHRLVAEAFIGTIAHGLDVCHINGNRFNNSSANLRIDTRASNMADAFAHGAVPLGSARANSKLNEDIVKRLRSGDGSAFADARSLGASSRSIRDAANRITWKHVG